MADFYWNRHPGGPFATLIAVTTGYLCPEWACPALLRRRASGEPDEEMRPFKAQLREAVLHPERLPGDELAWNVLHDYGSDAAFLEQLWRYLYGAEPAAGPGAPGASWRAVRPGGATLQYESVRTVTDVEKRAYGQVTYVIPAGAEGIIRRTWPDGTKWAELVIAPRTEAYDDDDDGGLAEVILTAGQYEIITAWPPAARGELPARPGQVTPRIRM